MPRRRTAEGGCFRLWTAATRRRFAVCHSSRLPTIHPKILRQNQKPCYRALGGLEALEGLFVWSSAPILRSNFTEIQIDPYFHEHYPALRSGRR